MSCHLMVHHWLNTFIGLVLSSVYDMGLLLISTIRRIWAYMYMYIHTQDAAYFGLYTIQKCKYMYMYMYMGIYTINLQLSVFKYFRMTYRYPKINKRNFFIIIKPFVVYCLVCIFTMSNTIVREIFAVKKFLCMSLTNKN